MTDAAPAEGTVSKIPVKTAKAGAVDSSKDGKKRFEVKKVHSDATTRGLQLIGDSGMRLHCGHGIS